MTPASSPAQTIRSSDYARVIVDRTHARSMVATRSGVVASEHPLASQAGASVLAAGGHAVDAAIAANAVMGVVAPMMNGVGGDLFAIVRDAARDRLHGLNASGWAPAGLSPKRLASLGMRGDAAGRHPRGHGAGCGGRLGRAARQVRPAAAGTCAGAGRRGRARRLSRVRVGGGGVAGQRGHAARTRQRGTHVPAVRAAHRAPATSFATPTSPRPTSRSRQAGGTPSMRATSPRRLLACCRGPGRRPERRPICTSSSPNGCSRSRCPTAAGRSTSCRRTGRASRR